MCFDGMLKDFPDIKWILGGNALSILNNVSSQVTGRRSIPGAHGSSRSARTER